MNTRVFPIAQALVLFGISIWVQACAVADVHLDGVRHAPAADVPWKYKINFNPNDLVFRPILSCKDEIGAITVPVARLWDKKIIYGLVPARGKSDTFVWTKSSQSKIPKDGLRFRIYLPDLFGKDRANCKKLANLRPLVKAPKGISKNQTHYHGAIKDLRVSLPAIPDSQKKYVSDYKSSELREHRTCGPRWIRDPIKEGRPALYALVLPKKGDCKESGEVLPGGDKAVPREASTEYKPDKETTAKEADQANRFQAFEIHVIKRGDKGGFIEEGRPKKDQWYRVGVDLASRPINEVTLNPAKSMPYFSNELDKITGSFNIVLKLPGNQQRQAIKFDPNQSLPLWPGVPNIDSCSEPGRLYRHQNISSELIAVFCPGIRASASKPSSSTSSSKKAKKRSALVHVQDQIGEDIVGITDWILYEHGMTNNIPRASWSVKDQGHGVYRFVANNDDLKLADLAIGSMPSQIHCDPMRVPIPLEFTDSPREKMLPLSCSHPIRIRLLGGNQPGYKFKIFALPNYTPIRVEPETKDESIVYAIPNLNEGERIRITLQYSGIDEGRYDEWRKKLTLKKEDFQNGKIDIPVKLKLKRYSLQFVFTDSQGNPVEGVPVWRTDLTGSPERKSTNKGIVELKIDFPKEEAKVAFQVPEGYEYDRYSPETGEPPVIGVKVVIIKLSPKKISNLAAILKKQPVRVEVSLKRKPINLQGKTFQPYVKVDGREIAAKSCKIKTVTLLGDQITTRPMRNGKFRLTSQKAITDPNTSITFYFGGRREGGFTLCDSAPVSMKVKDLQKSGVIHVPVGLTPPWLFYFGDGGRTLNTVIGYNDRVAFWRGAVDRLSGLNSKPPRGIKQPSVVRAYAVKPRSQIKDLLSDIDRSNISKRLSQYGNFGRIVGEIINTTKPSADSVAAVLKDAVKRLQGYRFSRRKQEGYKALVLYLFDAWDADQDFCTDLADWVKKAGIKKKDRVRWVLIGGTNSPSFGQNGNTGINRCDAASVKEMLKDYFNVSSFEELGVYPYLFSWKTTLSARGIGDAIDDLLANSHSPLKRALTIDAGTER